MWLPMKAISKTSDTELILRINEIFYSIQGESTQSGRPCVFIRLTYCNLRCSYCDTQYAFFEGTEMTISQILEQVRQYQCKLVEVTGGEPLIQENVLPLMTILCDEGFEVLLETAGHMDISVTDPRVKRIMDIKCPSSGESGKNRWSNIDHLQSTDEVKFVVDSEDDLEWAERIIEKYDLCNRCAVIFSPVFDKINYRDLAEWVLQSHLPIRMQVQLHKLIWEPDTRGV